MELKDQVASLESSKRLKELGVKPNLKGGGVSSELDSMNNEPVMSEVFCQQCNHSWFGFFPDGISFDKAIECPKCGDMYGMLVPIKI